MASNLLSSAIIHQAVLDRVVLMQWGWRWGLRCWGFHGLCMALCWRARRPTTRCSSASFALSSPRCSWQARANPSVAVRSLSVLQEAPVLDVRCEQGGYREGVHQLGLRHDKATQQGCGRGCRQSGLHCGKATRWIFACRWLRKAKEIMASEPAHWFACESLNSPSSVHSDTPACGERTQARPFCEHSGTHACICSCMRVYIHMLTCMHRGGQAPRWTSGWSGTRERGRGALGRCCRGRSPSAHRCAGACCFYLRTQCIRHPCTHFHCLPGVLAPAYPGREAPEDAWCRRLLLRMSCFCTQSTEALQDACRRACMLPCKAPETC